MLHCFQSTAWSAGDHRHTSGLGLHQGNAEILRAGEDEASCLAQEAFDFGVAGPAGEFDVRTCRSLEGTTFAARSDNDQATSQPVERFDDQVDALVRYQRAY